MDVPLLKVLRGRLDGDPEQPGQVELSMLMVGASNSMILKVPSNPNPSMVSGSRKLH